MATWVRTLTAAIRELLGSARRHLTTSLGRQGLGGVFGVACLAIDCVTLGSMLLA